MKKMVGVVVVAEVLALQIEVSSVSGGGKIGTLLGRNLERATTM